MILIAGPCVIESEKQLFRIAEGLKDISQKNGIDFYFKASFDKANRTNIESFRGPGLKEGLRLLKEVKEKFGYKLLTDVHETYQIKPVSKVVDVIQIPAFLCRQTDLLVEAGKSGKIVNIKKGQFMNPEDMKYSVEKVLKSSNYSSEIWLTERGSFFGYGNLVVDMRSLVIMKKFAKVIFDATHCVQMPGAEGGKSGGKREFVKPLARAAAGVGVDGFFFETHYNPQEALSDGANMLEISDFKKAVQEITKIDSCIFKKENKEQ